MEKKGPSLEDYRRDLAELPLEEFLERYKQGKPEPDPQPHGIGEKPVFPGPVKNLSDLAARAYELRTPSAPVGSGPAKKFAPGNLVRRAGYPDTIWRVVRYQSPEWVWIETSLEPIMVRKDCLELALPKAGEWWAYDKCPGHSAGPAGPFCCADWESDYYLLPGVRAVQLIRCGCLHPVNFKKGER